MDRGNVVANHFQRNFFGKVYVTFCRIFERGLYGNQSKTLEVLFFMQKIRKKVRTWDAKKEVKKEKGNKKLFETQERE